MKPIFGLFAFFLVIACAFNSCQKDGTIPDIGYAYFPNKVGHYVVYDVDSFYYNSFTSKIDSFKFQLKEKKQSIYTDNEGRSTIRLERYVKQYSSTVPYSSMAWTLRNVWAENRTATTAEKVEENQRFIKLAFPVKSTQTWNGNAQNTNGDEMYKYAFINQGRTIAGIYFDSTLQVTQHDELNLILKKYYIEKFAKNTGLVFKHVIDVSSQPNPNWSNPLLFPFGNDSIQLFYSKDIMLRVSSGVQYIQTVNSYGIEP